VTGGGFVLQGNASWDAYLFDWAVDALPFPGRKGYGATRHKHGILSVKSEVKSLMKIESELLLERITVNPNVLVGKPVIRGLRISVEQILRALAGGVSVEELLHDYPDLERDDIRAAIVYAAERVAEERVYQLPRMEMHG
jgi:uncharacterized protein (DUF433 family)